MVQEYTNNIRARYTSPSQKLPNKYALNKNTHNYKQDTTAMSIYARKQNTSRPPLTPEKTSVEIALQTSHSQNQHPNPQEQQKKKQDQIALWIGTQNGHNKNTHHKGKKKSPHTQRSNTL